jgi:FG-GAP-like repeat/Putative metal-binding motif
MTSPAPSRHCVCAALLALYLPLHAGSAAGAEGSAFRFTDVTDQSVMVPYRGMWTSSSTLEINPHPAPAWADWDGDGDLDLPGYRNDGGSFVDVSASSGLLTYGHYRGAVWGDFDADGDPDAMVHAYTPDGREDMLFRNDGDGTFTDIAPDNGMNTAGYGESANWGDYDGDGDLDLLAGNYNGGFMWRNDGGGSFTDVMASTGISMDITKGTDGCQNGTTRPEGMSLFDYDGDGWLDTYVSGHFWRNAGDGTFTDITDSLGGLRVGYHDESFAPADIDNDGDFDLAILYQYCATLAFLAYDSATGTYSEVGALDATNSLVGLRWADADNDGDLDLLALDYYEPYYDTWYRNDGDWTFFQVNDWRFDDTGASQRWQGGTASVGDYDTDGDLDLAIWKYEEPSDPIVQYRVLRSDLDPDGGWLRVRVVDESGHSTQHGATVRLTDASGTSVQTRYVDGGTNWTVDAYDVHYGVDDSAEYRLSVTFPRHAGEDLLVLDADANDCLSILPASLVDRTILVGRDGTVWLDGTPCLPFDHDGDGYADWEEGGDDCDDTDPGVYPGATDAPYDGVDADCAGDSDFDQDADGFDAVDWGGEDCDDTAPATHPGAEDSWYDGVDTDCAGNSDYDQDGDGHDSEDWGGDDCEDDDPDVYPGASPADDGTAQDCGDTAVPVEDTQADTQVDAAPGPAVRCGCAGTAAPVGVGAWGLGALVLLARRRGRPAREERRG